MSNRRAMRRAVNRSGAVAEIRRLRENNAALALFLRGAIRAAGGRLPIARGYAEGPQDEIVADPTPHGVVLSLKPLPTAEDNAVQRVVDNLDNVPWGS